MTSVESVWRWSTYRGISKLSIRLEIHNSFRLWLHRNANRCIASVFSKLDEPYDQFRFLGLCYRTSWRGKFAYVSVFWIVGLGAMLEDFKREVPSFTRRCFFTTVRDEQFVEETTQRETRRDSRIGGFLRVEISGGKNLVSVTDVPATRYPHEQVFPKVSKPQRRQVKLYLVVWSWLLLLDACSEFMMQVDFRADGIEASFSS